jgi:hypothetical protein
MLVYFLSSKWMGQRVLAIPIIQCGISFYHSNNHFNSIQSSNHPPCPSQHTTDVDCYQAYAECIGQLPRQFCQVALLSYTNSSPIPPRDINSIQATTRLTMLHIAAHLLAAGRAAISELQMKILLNQAEKCALEFVQAKSKQPSLNSAQAPDLLSSKQSDTAC